MSQYNTVVAQVNEIVENRNGTVTLIGVVDQSIGDDYERGNEVVATVFKSVAHSVRDRGKGIYLLEKVNPENQSCGFATFIKNDVCMALIGPIQVSWQDDQDMSHYVTFDEGGIENKMEDVKVALRRYAKSLRVSRDMINLDESGNPVSYFLSADDVDRKALDIIDENPNATAFLIRDGERAVTARLHWDDDSNTRYFVWPLDKDGLPIAFKGDVEIIPISRMEYLRNAFDPKKSTAYSVVNAMLGKSEKQLAYEGKLYPTWDTHATGFVITRMLPRGGVAIEQTAISFPAMRRGEVPGEMPLDNHRRNSRPKMGKDSIADFLRAFAAKFGIEPEQVESFLSSQKNGNQRNVPAASRGETLGAGSRSGLEQAGAQQSTAKEMPADGPFAGNGAAAGTESAGNMAAQGMAAGEREGRRQPPAVRPTFGAGRRR